MIMVGMALPEAAGLYRPQSANSGDPHTITGYRHSAQRLLSLGTDLVTFDLFYIVAFQTFN